MPGILSGRMVAAARRLIDSPRFDAFILGVILANAYATGPPSQPPVPPL